jgi:hypothetical protein
MAELYSVGRIKMTLPKAVVWVTLPVILLGTAGCSEPRRAGLTDPEVRFNVNGGSFVTTGGAEITLIVNDFTERWSFNAKGSPAKGNFNFVSRLFGGTVQARGDILCYSISGNRARLGGLITSSTAPELIGSEAIWSVEDNGEGSAAVAADRATALELGDAQSYCLVPPIPDPKSLPIETGNVQVHP